MQQRQGCVRLCMSSCASLRIVVHLLLRHVTFCHCLYIHIYNNKKNNISSSSKQPTSTMWLIADGWRLSNANGCHVQSSIYPFMHSCTSHNVAYLGCRYGVAALAHVPTCTNIYTCMYAYMPLCHTPYCFAIKALTRMLLTISCQPPQSIVIFVVVVVIVNYMLLMLSYCRIAAALLLLCAHCWQLDWW